MTGTPRVLGWPSPWTGDEADPAPPSYRAWYRLYRWTRRAKHRVGWHDWRPVGITDRPDTMYVQRHCYCDWCGARKPLRRPLPS